MTDEEKNNSVISSEAVEKHDGARQEEAVDWDSPDDPANPLNWPMWRKIATVSLVSLVGFTAPFSSDVAAPAIGYISDEFYNSNQSLASFVVSVFVLGNAIGPLVFAPASEIWGRNLILNISNILFIIFSIATAVSPSLATLCVFRFLAGCVGSAPLAVGGGTLADLIPREQRGRFFFLFSLGPQLGPLISPVAGGFLGQDLGWRWTCWIVVIIHAVISIAFVLLAKETYAPVLLRRKANRLAKASGSSSAYINDANRTENFSKFRKAWTRPTKMLFQSPIVFFLALFQATAFGYRFLLYTNLTGIFVKNYGFSTGITGLTFLGSAIGVAIAMYVYTWACDHAVKRAKVKKPDEKPPPEVRLGPMVWASPLIPLGLFLFGWSAEYRIHWIVPVIGLVVFGAGIVGASLPGNVYMVDAFTNFAASGLAASFFLRSVAGGVLPLAGQPMFARLGVGWGSSLLAFIALAMCAFPPVIYRYGGHVRKRFPVDL